MATRTISLATAVWVAGPDRVCLPQEGPLIVDEAVAAELEAEGVLQVETPAKRKAKGG